MFRSLRFKLTAAFVIVIVVTLSIVLRFVVSVTNTELNQYDQARTEFAQTLIPTVPAPPTWNSESAPDVPPFSPVFPRGFGTAVAGERDQEVWVVVPLVDERVPIRELVVEAARGGNTGSQFLSDVQGAARLAIFVAGALSIVIGVFIFREFTRPLEKLRRAVQSLAAGELNVRIPVSSKDEVGRVATAFNQMAAQLESQERLRQQMIADVAHELRTPVSIVQGSIEAMMDGLLEPSAQELSELHEEMERLTRLIEDLRFLSLADARQLQLSLGSVEIAELIESVASLMSPMAGSGHAKIRTELPSTPLFVRGDRDKLKQAMTNLVGNGLRHASPGGQVTIGAAKAKGEAHIFVTDDGPGIPEADLPHIFERFWRGDKSRSRHSGGSGLGLSIVKQIAEIHGGSITVASPAGGLTRFTLTLPLE